MARIPETEIERVKSEVSVQGSHGEPGGNHGVRTAAAMT